MRAKKTLVIAGLAATAATVAGCGSANPTATTGGQPPGSPTAAAFKYAECIRNHGVAGFPDPQVSSSPGRVSIAIMAPASLAASRQFKSAQRACRGILPVPGNTGRSNQLASKPEFLAFARCLRVHGVSDFPDPNPQGQITQGMLRAAGIDLHSQVFLRAAMNCVGVTHGAITPADVRAAVSGPH
jgi:hypothetical protein